MTKTYDHNCKLRGMCKSLLFQKSLDNVGSSRHFGRGQNIPDKEAPSAKHRVDGLASTKPKNLGKHTLMIR